MPKTNYKTHSKAHRTILKDEYLFGETTLLKRQFNVAKTAERQATAIEILGRAKRAAALAKNKPRAADLKTLARKLIKCAEKKRCGSLACPQCARASQIAKTKAHRQFIKSETAEEIQDLAYVTLIPEGMMFTPAGFSKLDVDKANRWLKDQLRKAKITSPVVGSMDFGWEDRRSGHGARYMQLHWHLTMWAEDIKHLRKQLKRVFPSSRKHEKSVKATRVKKMRCIAYTHKAIKLPELSTGQS